jgi:hypothetical protein
LSVVVFGEVENHRVMEARVNIIKQAYTRMVHSTNGGWDVVAASLAMTVSAISNRVYERKNQRMHVETALLMQEISGTTFFAEAVAQVSGGTFLKLPEIGDISGEEISSKFHELFEEFGELSKEYREMTRDGNIDDEELDKLNKLTQRMHVTMDEIRALTISVYRPQGA